MITALTELPDGKLVSILDVEQILGEVMGEGEVPNMDALRPEHPSPVFFRRRLQPGPQENHGSAGETASCLIKAPSMAVKPGKSCATSRGRAEQENRNLKEVVSLILVDAEMPEMDGYVLTRHIKEDARFNGIPVVMHSSLSSVANKKLGQQVGVDAYVGKFHPEELAQMVTSMLHPA